MGRIYEDLKDRMKSVDRRCFSMSYGIKMIYEFTPDLSDCFELEELIKEEKNSILKAIMKRPVVYVEVKQLEESGTFCMTWSVGFEGMEFREFCFSIDDVFHNNNEIECVAMWLTYNNNRADNLCWQCAVEKLYEIYGKELEAGWHSPFTEEDEDFEDEDSESDRKVVQGAF